jgi:carboxypeptidase D
MSHLDARAASPYQERVRSRPALATVVVALALALAGTTASSRAAGRGEPGPVRTARVELVDRTADLARLEALDLDIDAVFGSWARVYLLPEEIGKLHALGFTVELLPPEPREDLSSEPAKTSIPTSYHTYAALTAELQSLAAAHPAIARLHDLGPSVQGRRLWMMRISDAPDVDEDEPELAYISSMHGDEVVGQELLIGLIRHLLEGYGTDPRVTSLVDGNTIWIMPSMNPDGTALASRYNANGFDLNRDFPDQFVDPVNTPVGRQPETSAVMAWGAAQSIGLAANFHGGALVVSYPFDGEAAGLSIFNPTPPPDHPAFLSLSRTYADASPPMSTSNADPAWDDGVTNGAAWYSITGGMQDWAYVWRGTFEVTIELDDAKWPPASRLPQLWSDNLESLLAYLERAREGLRGIVTDAETGVPLAATIRLDADPFATRTDPDVGDYHRLVLPGTYAVTVDAPGYTSQSFAAVVAPGAATRRDVALLPRPTELTPIAERVLDGPAGNAELDAGETTALAVELANAGRSADGVVARLVPTGWFADATRPAAAYPSIPLGGSAESSPPHHEIRVRGDAPAGHKAGFAVEWTTSLASGVAGPLFLPVGEPACETLEATDLPAGIANFGVTTSTIDVAAERELASVRVTLDIRHTYVGDLRVSLVSPAGTVRILHERSGGSSDDLVGTYGGDLTPFEPLDALAGESSLGAWRLEVRDLAAGNTGSLESFGLELCGRPFEAQPPEMRFRAVRREGQAARFDWWPYPGLDSYRVYRSADASAVASFIDLTAQDDDATDTTFLDSSAAPLLFYLVTGVGPRGESPLGHSGL